MYTLSANTLITGDLIKDFIDRNDKAVVRGRSNRLFNYYYGNQDILNRSKSSFLKNNKLVVNHASYIVDVNVGQLLGQPVEWQAKDNTDIDFMLEYLDSEENADLNIELATDNGIFGRIGEYIYADEFNQLNSAKIDPRNYVCVYDNTFKHDYLFTIIYSDTKGNNATGVKEYPNVFVVDKNNITDWSDVGGTLTKGNEVPHYFGEVPFVEFRNNSGFRGDFEDVLPLIDAYNLLQSDRINDKEQLLEAILVLYGFTLDAEDMELLKQNRVMGGLPATNEGAKAEYLIKQLMETEVDVLAKSIEDKIHKISKTPNLSDENFIGNASGVAIRYKLLVFQRNINKKGIYFTKGLKRRFRLYNNYLNKLQGRPLIPLLDVDPIYKQNLPQDDFQTSQMIANLQGFITKETAISQLSFIDDSSKELEALKKEEAEMMQGENNFGSDVSA